MKTSDFGVASADFQLADEVNAGDYHIRAVLADHTADKTVAVKPYVLPKFKADVTADKRFYLPKETIKADLQSDYFFGKPVAGAKVKVDASTFDVAFKDFQTIDAKTDAAGPREIRDPASRLFRRSAVAEGRRPGEAGSQDHGHGGPHRDDHAAPTRSATSRSA